MTYLIQQLVADNVSSFWETCPEFEEFETKELAWKTLRGSWLRQSFSTHWPSWRFREKRLERLCLIEQSTWGNQSLVFVIGRGVCQQLERGFPTNNMELNMTTAPTVQALFFRAEQKNKSRVITHHSAPSWKKLWWRVRLYFINQKYARRLRKIWSL